MDKYGLLFLSLFWGTMFAFTVKNLLYFTNKCSDRGNVFAKESDDKAKEAHKKRRAADHYQGGHAYSPGSNESRETDSPGPAFRGVHCAYSAVRHAFLHR